MSRLVWWVRRVRDSFWFLPTVCTLVAVVAVELLVAADRRQPDGGWSLGGLLLEVGADGSRGMLSAIATSMLAAAATSFSITIAVLALTSSSYGPRLVRNFLADRGNQLVLGVLVAVAVYALLALRHVRMLDPGSDSAFVPHLAVNVAVLLAIAGVGALVYFIHHVSVAIQVSTLSTRVRGTLARLVDDLYPEDQPTGTMLVVAPLVAGTAGVTVRAAADGYVQVVDGARVLRAAAQHGLLVDVLRAPGDYVLRGDPLARVGAADGPVAAGASDAVGRAVHAAVGLGPSRTPDQDVRYAIDQHVDLAARAMSPGVNDPITALNALDDLSAGLARLAARPAPSTALVDDDGVARVRLNRPDLRELLVGVVDLLAVVTAAQPAVASHLLLVLERVARVALDESTTDVACELADAVLQHVRRVGATSRDLARLEEQVQGLRDRVSRERAGRLDTSGGAR